MYHMEKGEWEKVIFSEPYGYECVNGTLRRKFVGWCDVVMCGRQAVNKQMEYEWDMKVFREGEKKVCELKRISPMRRLMHQKACTR